MSQDLKIIVPWVEPENGDKTLNELYPDGNFTYPEEWIAPYYGKSPNFGYNGVGWAVYVRTYSREMEELERMEAWTDSQRRVFEGNYSIKFTHGQLDRTATLREACRMFHINWHLGEIPPGRSLWMSGSRYMKERAGGGDALNNCWGVLTIPMPVTSDGPILVSTPFHFLLDQAMKGGGVGANIEDEHVMKIPAVKNTVELLLACHHTHPNVDEVEPDFRDEIPADIALEPHTTLHVVEDSRQGWGNALSILIDAHWNGTKRVILDLSSIRRNGAKLTFGGRASGPGPLSKFRKINEIINARFDQRVLDWYDHYLSISAPWNLSVDDQQAFELDFHPEDFADGNEWIGKLDPIDCGDIYQIIGTIVVAGNIRRTAIILVGSRKNQRFVESKQYAKVGWEPSQWRWASNNSVDVGPDTPYEYFRHDMGPSIYYNGEPGYVNTYLAQNYGRIVDGLKLGCDQYIVIFNPCGEIGLVGGFFEAKTMKWFGGEPCNLYEVSPLNLFLLGFDYLEAAALAARFAYRVTFTPYEWEMSRNIIQRNRRLGVAVTGVTDWCMIAFNSNIVTGLDETGEPIFCQPYVETLDAMYCAVVEANHAQADGNGTERSIKVTTVKPSGTVSLLLGNPPGQHYHWAEYWIRRVTAAVDSPITDAAIAVGLPIEPKITGRDKDTQEPIYDMKTAVIEFPVKAPSAGHPLFRSAADVPLWEQAMVQESLAAYWADNAVSATLNFHAAEKQYRTPDGEVVSIPTNQTKKQPREDWEFIGWKDGRTDDDVLDEIAKVLFRAKDRIKSTSLLPYDNDSYDQMPYEPITAAEYERRVAAMKGNIADFYKGGYVKDELDASAECASGNCPVR